MARLTFPTAAEAFDRTSVTPDQSGATFAPDGMSSVTLDQQGSISLTLTTDSGHTSVLSAADRSGWTLLTDEPGALPEPVIARLNRWFSSESASGTAPSVARNWRTKGHDLRGKPRQVLPITPAQPMALVRAADGWHVQPGKAPTTPAAQPAPSAANPSPAPVTPAEAPAAAPTKGTSAPNDLPVMGVPLQYSGKIVMSKGNRNKWKAARAGHKRGAPKVVCFIGPSGAGKTHAAYALSAEDGMDVYKFDASAVVEPGDWFGGHQPDEHGGIVFVPSDLLLGLTAPGGPRTVLVDEVNRSALRALNAMLPVFDHSGSFTIPQSGKRAQINRNVQIVLTANIGSRFLGTEPLDEAIRTRIGSWIKVDHLPEDQEKQLLLDRVPGLSDYDAGNLARLGVLLREAATKERFAPVGTRQLLAAADAIVDGLTPREAVNQAVLDGYEDEGGAQSEVAKVRKHIAGIAWKQPSAAPAGPIDPTVACQCGHFPAEHAIGAVSVSADTHCRENDGCVAYDAAAADDDDTEGF